MKNRIRRLVPATLLVACALSAPAAQAAPASVQLRIEGRNTTIYEGPVTTDGKVVRPEPGEDHGCDGTNNGANHLGVRGHRAFVDRGVASFDA